VDNKEIYQKRIERDSHHGYIAFSMQNCINQQTAYRKVSDYLKTQSNIKVFDIATDNFAEAYASGSYQDAVYALKYNTEYPIALLDKGALNAKIDANYKREILDSSEISIKYKGYIEREQQMADKIMRLENLSIPDDFDFDKVESLSIECRQKLKKYSPRTIAQASRISGVSPADISVLLVYFGR
jgi:tRNA U34 5-carboxymethylaminomethyl modifying enzyme MnmG/GidA